MLDTEDIALPVLRDDLQLAAGPIALDGSPTWTLYDPLRGRYFRIGWAAFQMLSCWSVGTATALQETTLQDTTCALDLSQVREFVRFLFVNQLTEQAINADYLAFLQQYRASKLPWYQQLIHHYLFFRIPLLRPDGFLRATLPFIQWCFDLRLLYVLLGIGLLGGYLVSRQWEVFSRTFLHFFDWQGALFYALALVLSKLFHELGHGYTAVRFGCRVPVMGMAFMALFPMPYTDVTDAWRLPSRRQRMIIDAAGMIVELVLAVFATMAWSFLPDGSLRSAAFILATSAWLMTLAVNLSPFMRFDGYYLLADYWGVDNLQPRAFALARWRLRRWCLGLATAKPEQLAPAMETKLVLYAFGTWIYRLFIFTGLALMVYHLFFKLLGLLLFFVEIVFFIIRPIWQELRIWPGLVGQTASGRRKLAMMLTGLLILGLFFLPWSDSVTLPAILEARQHTRLYVPEAAQIQQVYVKPGQPVSAGEVLLSLKLPKLDDDIRLSEKRLTFYQLRLERAATTREAAADIKVAMQQWAAESARLQGLRQQRERLSVRAPFTGTVMDLAPALHTQRWINSSAPLLTLVAPEAAYAEALADKDAILVLNAGQQGRFVPDDLLSKCVTVQVEQISKINVYDLTTPYLASIYEGPIAVRKNVKGQLVPNSSVFTVKLAAELVAPQNILRGNVIIQAKPRSFAQRLFDQAAAVLIRESGF